MTAIAAHQDSDHGRPGLAEFRILGTFRLHFLVRHAFILVPLLVFVASWLLAMGVGVLAGALADSPATATDPVYGGVSMASLFALLITAALSVSQTLPFAMALSYSRRTYVLGALLAFVVVSAVYGILFTVVAFLENTTDGLGLHHYHFALPILLDNGGYLGAGTIAFTLALFLMLFGFLLATLYRRLPLLTFWSVGILVLLAVAVITVLLVHFVGWGSMWQWFTDQSTYSIGAWLLLASAAFAAVSYALLRRATPTG